MATSNLSTHSNPKKADKLKEKYVAEIEARIEDIKRVEKIGAETEVKTTSKRKATRVISWLDAKLAPEKTSSTGPGCSICISTFEEIQADGKTVGCHRVPGVFHYSSVAKNNF